jgi:hypothetical protein
MTLPIKAFWQYFKGLKLVDTPVWYRELQGDCPQIVLTPYGVIEERSDQRYSEYSIQVACWHTNPDSADTQAQVVRNYFKAYDDNSSACPPVIFGTWHAQSVQVQYQGVIDSLEITKGILYKAVVNLTLINLEEQL